MKKLLFLLLVFKSFLAFPQLSHPPSPEAARITQFDLHPANIYTGTQAVNIPLYSMDFEGAPISLNLLYHASGIRVSENAGNVGLGWSISPVGSITRIVKGYDDLANYSQTNRAIQGYLHDTQTVPPGFNYNWWNTYLASGKRDTEPDIFSYSFLNSSGKFIFNKKVNSSSPVTVTKLEKNTDKIEYNVSGNTFTITDENGFKAIFSVKEYSTSVGGTCLGFWQNCDMNLIDFNQTILDGGRLVTTWYLSKIVSPLGKELNFNYDINPSNGFSDYLSISPFNWSEFDSFEASYGSYIPNNNYGYSRQIFENVYISSIQSSDYDLNITFNYGDRLDIEKFVSPNQNSTFQGWLSRIQQDRNNYLGIIKNPKKLQNITISNLSTPITFSKQILFNQSYFNPNAIDKIKFSRLRLNSVLIGDQKYDFTYFEGLPSKESKGIDYWGYYNGRDNNTALKPVTPLLPSLNIDYPGYIDDNYYYQTPNRSANFEFGKAGLLTSVTYPTGGKSTFEYEAHQYKLEGSEIVYPSNFTLYGNGILQPQTKTFYYKGFGISGCTGSINVRLSVRCKDYFLGGPCTINQVDRTKIAVQLIGPSNNVIQELNYDWLHLQGVSNHDMLINFPSDPIGTNSLPAGTYTIKVFNVQSNGQTLYYGDARVEMRSQCSDIQPINVNVVKNQITGGARIKTIRQFDENNTRVMQKSYQYLNRPDISFSSGRLMNPLFHMSNFVTNEITLPDGTNTGLNYIFHQSNSGSSLENGNAAQGNHIGYSDVRVIYENGVGGNNGYEDYKFINKPNELYNFTSISFPSESLGSVRVTSFQDENGKNIFTKSFESTTNHIHQAVENTYQRDSTNQINAVKLSYLGGHRPLQLYYKLFISSHNLVSKTTNKGGQIITESFDYNAFNQLSKHTITHDLNNKFETLYKYTNDLPTTTGVLGLRKQLNIVGDPVESYTVHKTKIISGKGNLYKIVTINGSNVPLLDKSYVYNPDLTFYSSNGLSYLGGYYPVNEVIDYNSQGKPILIRENGVTNNTMIWGNNGRDLFGIVVNALPSQVSFTSFESDDKGGWTYNGTPISGLISKTGSKYYNLNNGSITKSSINASTSNQFKLTFWARRASGTGTWSFMGQTENLSTTWQLVQRTITTSQLEILMNGSNSHIYIDELRLHPVNSMMTTYTYKPLVGVISITDPRNLSIYYEYDAVNRLINIKNENNEILKVYDYNFINK
ncbi:hypothetical protein [Belliella pelovolcani]|uniref:YD repeat-containing protein n=1 Tax=Belliella pelovolcani TaxID=529505 RepID=A0A1N7MJY3_9BACT|nr:hypothetical protein [Belliella pelovolcani]SIS86455.1 hypothetical protein SAMN05421761_106162 [Belliella pelovolcani]